MPAVLSHTGSLLLTAGNLTIQRFLYKDRPAMICFLGTRIKFEMAGAIQLLDSQAPFIDKERTEHITLHQS